ncbi:hypothetical protein [Deinococcus hopiensis]|uniref:Uncharacterized protein n=1 Tax=Deinococcus hopiensis KR-140 TaxID=695939 RepID=A0A1W1VIL8_9DEIO|nr:hypothetical protein [Deinococcus hopiensis]SMB93217.1 hypothetical protein SAMN00790413_01894 [Deinococcus hopiensis KR-140]
MSRRPPEKPLQRLQRVLVPGTTGGLYTLVPGATGFYVILFMHAHSYFTGKPPPNEAITSFILTACVSMLGVHQIRGISADRANAANGMAPVPVDPSDAPTQTIPQTGSLPDLRPRD